jgi:membrane-associated phospholipid phosphatase
VRGGHALPMSSSSDAPPVLAPVIVAAAVIGGVVAAGIGIVAHPAWSAGEVRIVAAVGSVDNVVFDVAARTIDILFGPSGAILLTLIMVAAALVLRRSWASAVRALVVLAVPWALAETVKAVVRRPRPDPTALPSLHVPDPVSFSYPSGHTAFAAALCCAVVLVVVAGRHRRRAMWIGAAVVVVVGWSRVYLGVHYPTDVVASMVLVPPVALALDRVVDRLPLLSGAGPSTTPRGAQDASQRRR